MTTAEFASYFPFERERPSPWKPGQYRRWSELRDAALAVSSRADAVWEWYMSRPVSASEEGLAVQVVAMLDRVSGLLMLEAARVAEGVEL